MVISVPRCYFHLSDTLHDCVLYGFCDASVSAYAAVMYLHNGLNLVHCKTRVALLTQQTIPTLELLSGILLARLMHCGT